MEGLNGSLDDLGESYGGAEGGDCGYGLEEVFEVGGESLSGVFGLVSSRGSWVVHDCGDGKGIGRWVLWMLLGFDHACDVGMQLKSVHSIHVLQCDSGISHYRDLSVFVCG